MEKVMVVTGASSGIGAALAKIAGRAGASVVLVARRKAELERVAAESGPRTLVVVADVTKRADVQGVVAETVKKFGRIDVWVNNAGRGISRQVADLTDEDFDDMMLVNVKSALYGMQAVLPQMKAQNSGHIINVSSMLGRLPMASVRSAYSAAKHALQSLTANLRMDMRAEHPGIHVSSVIPGVVATDFGLHSMHGGIDSRSLPFAQPVDEVAHVILELIARPRAEVYTRPTYQHQVAEYYAAADLDDVESKPPFVKPL